MAILETLQKDKYQSSLENCCIQKLTNPNLQLNGTQIDTQNPALNILNNHSK